MLSAFSAAARSIAVPRSTCEVLRKQAVWVDLLSPTREEELLVKQCLRLAIPPHDDMDEMEPSARLHEEGGLLHLKASVLSGEPGERVPRIAPVALILGPNRLVTVRYVDSRPFRDFMRDLTRQPELCESPASALVFLLEGFVECASDLLRGVAEDVDSIRGSVFRHQHGKARKRLGSHALEDLMCAIGSAEEMLSKVGESLTSLNRLISFLLFALPRYGPSEVAHLKTVARNVAALETVAESMGANITFLLDAALGLINIQQNAIIKIFSVAAVIFLPPTLVGTVYGMNFEHMPELGWLFGYPLALAAMLLSAVVPYLWFQMKGWL